MRSSKIHPILGVQKCGDQKFIFYLEFKNAGLKSLEMLVTSLERKALPMPKLQAETSRELAFVEVDSTDHVRLKEIQTETE